MYSLNINNNNIINDLTIYMLHSIKSDSTKYITDNDNHNNSHKVDKVFIPKSNIYVNYNKLKSKYNENTLYLKK